MPLLRVQEPGRPPRDVATSGRALIGRHASNDVALADAQASRHHAVLFVDRGTFYLEDLRSRNGTLVDGRRVRDAAVRKGSVFEVGQTRIEVLSVDGEEVQSGSGDSPLLTRDHGAVSDLDPTEVQDFALRRAWRDLIALQDLVTRVHGATSPEEILENLAVLASRSTGAQKVWILLPEDPADLTRTRVAVAWPRSTTPPPASVLLSDEVARAVWRGEGRWCADTLTERQGDLLPYPSIVVQSLRGHRSAGALVVYWSQPKGFDTYHLEIVSTLGLQGGIALDKFTLFGELEANFFGTIDALVNALEARDGYTAGHSRRVARISEVLARRLGLAAEEIKGLRLGALLHDIGKIGVDDELLKTERRYGPEERKAMERHPQFGDQILAPLRGLASIRPVVRHHHERWDGAGYPDRLGRSCIPLASRIVGVADTLDAITSKRSYRDSRPISVALEEIRKCAGTQFDPHVVEALLAVVAEEGEAALN